MFALQMEHCEEEVDPKEDPKSWMKWFFVCEKGHAHFLEKQAKLTRLKYRNYIDVIEARSIRIRNPIIQEEDLRDYYKLYHLSLIHI